MDSTPRENIALVREFLTTVVAEGDTNALSIFLSEDEVDHRPASYAGVDSELVGASYWSALAAADLDITIDDIVATDQKVAVRGSVIGIPSGSLLAGEPTERSFEIATVWFCRVENGQIQETWSLPSESWLLGQLNTSVRGT